MLDGASPRHDSGGELPADAAVTDAGHADSGLPEDPCAVRFLDRQWGTDRDDEVRALLADAEGHVIAAGYLAGKLGVADDGPTGNSAGFVERLWRGRARWVAGLDTDTSDIVEALTVGPDGALYFAGRTRGVVPSSTSRGGFDLVLGRVSDAGQVSWLGQHGTPRPEAPRAITFDQEGRLLVVGYTDIYIPTNYVEAWEDPFIAAFDSIQADSPPWQVYFTQFESPEYDFGYGVAAADDGRAWLVGAVVNGSNSGAYVADITQAGAVERVQRWSRGALENIAAVARAADGDLILAGTTNLKLGAESFGQQDAFVAKVDPASLTPRWVTQLGSSEFDWVTSMALGAAGQTVVVGETFGAFHPGAEVGGVGDVFAFQVDGQGEPMWTWQGGSQDNDTPSSVVIDACGDVIVGGSTNGDFVSASLGSRDAFVVRARTSDL
jgi:hypothetical protein